jgi:hypothetical protein
LAIRCRKFPKEPEGGEKARGLEDRIVAMWLIGQSCASGAPAEFPVKQGKYREIRDFRAGKPLLQVKHHAISAG